MGWQPTIGEWKEVIARLRSEGFTIVWETVAFPVQLAGLLPDGSTFYFRERDGLASLGVGGIDPFAGPGDDADPEWETEESLWEEKRGWYPFLEPEEAYDVFHWLLLRWPGPTAREVADDGD